jgi:hypothetical protein
VRHPGIELAKGVGQLGHSLIADHLAPSGLKVGQDCLGQPDALPAGLGEHNRQILNQGAIAAVAIVCMTAGGRATLPDGADRGPLPWAA